MRDYGPRVTQKLVTDQRTWSWTVKTGPSAQWGTLNGITEFLLWCKGSTQLNCYAIQLPPTGMHVYCFHFGLVRQSCHCVMQGSFVMHCIMII